MQKVNTQDDRGRNQLSRASKSFESCDCYSKLLENVYACDALGKTS